MTTLLAPEILFPKAGIPLVLLADIGLDDPDRASWLALRSGGRDRPRASAEKQNGRSRRAAGAAMVPAKQKQQRARGQQGEARQSVGADPSCRPGQAGVDEGDAHRVPGEAGEQGGSEPFGDDPGGGEEEHEDERMAPPPAPRQTGRGGRIDGEVERQQDHRHPTEPGRHRRLVGEGGGDPVEAEDELAEAEPPAAGQRRAKGRRPLDQPQQGEQRGEHDRPKADRLEAERSGDAGDEGEAEIFHRQPLWRPGSAAVNGTCRGRGEAGGLCPVTAIAGLEYTPEGVCATRTTAGIVSRSPLERSAAQSRSFRYAQASRRRQRASRGDREAAGGFWRRASSARRSRCVSIVPSLLLALHQKTLRHGHCARSTHALSGRFPKSEL